MRIALSGKLGFLLCSIVLSGCETTHPSLMEIDSSNYRTKIKVSTSGWKFYSAEYTGTRSNCFPQITGRDCTGETEKTPYGKATPLNMEEFTISITSSANDASKRQDFINMVGADIAIQKGYRYFTVVSSRENTFCLSRYSARTSGQVYGDSYSGRTTLDRKDTCANTKSIDLIAFNEPKDLENGVFFRVPDAKDGSIRLKPYKSLYFNTMSGLRYSDFNEQNTRSELDSTSTSILITRSEAWKHYYVASGVSKEFREKYSLTGNVPYTILDESDARRKSVADDVMERNRAK